MTVVFYLIRHAAHDNVGNFLAGRMPGITLGPAGLDQAARLGRRMAGEPIDAIYVSPRERTRQTAEAIASTGGFAAPEPEAALDEIDFGAWSGRTFEDLNTDPGWQRWNEIRSLSRSPGGESMLDVQIRIVRLMEQLAHGTGERRIALVSHADVIKAAVGHVLGLPVDLWSRFDIAPASITTIVWGDWGARLHTLNENLREGK